MATIIKPPYFEQVVNAGEKKLLDFLEVNLPDNYFLIPNVEIASTNPKNFRTQYWEYDLIVVAPHAVFNIENKDWKGRIEGDDNYWYLNDRQMSNPLKTGRQKTAVLASKLKENNPTWGKAWVQNMLTLSYDNIYTPVISSDAYKLTFSLNERLLDFILSPEKVGKDENAIADIQHDIVKFLTGQQSKKSSEEKREVQGYEIVEILQQETNFTEYLVKEEGNTPVRRRIKEYALQVSGMSPEELRTREDQIKNQYNALKNLKNKPFILNVEFMVDNENHLFYEISDFMDENSLRSEARHKTFTFKEKLQIIENVMVALREAHQKGIFHRDVNPENIYLASGYAYLGNFGKSYFLDHNEEGYTVMPTINQTNATAYHPLELTVNDANASSDIYSLGVLIYWLFTEKEPFSSPYALDKMGGKIQENLLPSKVNPNLPKWLDEVCLKTILTDDQQRLQTVEELQELINSSIQSHSENTEPADPKPVAIPAVPTFEELKEGDSIGAYTIHKVLGKGGYSKVFKVKHRIQDKYFTMKLFNESVNFNSVKDEYEALKNLNHPNIVKFVWNDEASNGQFFTVMEFLDGENLSNYTKTDAKLPLNKVLQLGKHMLNALVEMQSKEKPIMHRDIKPQNIIWDKGERFVLIDFNVASSNTQNKDFVGTNPYLAPDLIHENYQVHWDKSADVFALGVTLYELACKHYPWHPKKVARESEVPNDPKTFEPKISRQFADFLLKAIATDKNVRFKDASEMQEALVEIEDNILEDYSGTDDELPTINRLYHTQIFIRQGTYDIKLYNRQTTYVNLSESVDKVLSEFKSKIESYKPQLDQPIKLILRVDNEDIINENFWNGGAKTFTAGNIERVHSALKKVFEDNKDKIKAHKIDVEGANIVDYINSLYSQSRYGNFGTRVSAGPSTQNLDEATYTETKLDKKLIPAIVDGTYKLLIITGNAGDGKTAFIKKIEKNPYVKDVQHFEHQNGARFKIGSVQYESNYDGSQDEAESVNNEVLEKFFEPFEGLTNYDQAKEGRIIAINEGRLVEFFETSKKHKKLAEVIDKYFDKQGHYTLPAGLMIINLNLRSVVAENGEDGSLFRQQIKQLTKKELWKSCDSCELAKDCFIKYNVESFNDSASGNEVTTRMEWLLRTVSLKRELHITMRDLRSFIAYMLTRDFSCEDVKALDPSKSSQPSSYWQYYYFNITNPYFADEDTNDRLVKLLQETDIGEVAVPNLDRELFFTSHQEKDYLVFADREANLLEIFNENKSFVPAHELDEKMIYDIREKHKSFIRHQYFEAKFFNLITEVVEIEGEEGEVAKVNKPAYLLRIPYKSVFEFVNILRADKLNESIMQSISRAISLNEGCNNKTLDMKNLVISSTEVKDHKGKSFKLFPLSEFELMVNKTDHLTKYLEYESDSLTFRNTEHKHIALTISLDLYEMLYFIHKGFSPSLNDMKGKFIELLVFKNLLENLNYNEIVVTPDNKEFFSVKKDNFNKIAIKKLAY